MKIRNKFTGVVSTERGDIARAMIRQGMCEEIKDGTVITDSGEEYRMPQPGDAHISLKWSVVTITDMANTILPTPYAAIQLEVGKQFYRWSGNPKHANACRIWQGGQKYLNGLGRAIPEEILKQYVAVLKQNPELAHFKFNGEAIANFAAGGPANESQARDLKEANKRLKENAAGLAEKLE